MIQQTVCAGVCEAVRKHIYAGFQTGLRCFPWCFRMQDAWILLPASSSVSRCIHKMPSASLRHTRCTVQPAALTNASHAGRGALYTLAHRRITFALQGLARSTDVVSMIMLVMAAAIAGYALLLYLQREQQLQHHTDEVRFVFLFFPCRPLAREPYRQRGGSALLLGEGSLFCRNPASATCRVEIISRAICRKALPQSVCAMWTAIRPRPAASLPSTISPHLDHMPCQTTALPHNCAAELLCLLILLMRRHRRRSTSTTAARASSWAS